MQLFLPPTTHALNVPLVVTVMKQMQTVQEVVEQVHAWILTLVICAPQVHVPIQLEAFHVHPVRLVTLLVTWEVIIVQYVLLALIAVWAVLRALLVQWDTLLAVLAVGSVILVLQENSANRKGLLNARNVDKVPSTAFLDRPLAQRVEQAITVPTMDRAPEMPV